MALMMPQMAKRRSLPKAARIPSRLTPRKEAQIPRKAVNRQHKNSKKGAQQRTFFY